LDKKDLSLKIVKIEPRLAANIVLVAMAVACVVAAWFFSKWNFANTIAARMDISEPGADRLSDWLIQAAPGDPQTHLTAALIHGRTLDPMGLARSLEEYEASAAMSPNDYFRWLDLGRARGLSGDADGARDAYARAMELAPNYSAVQWAYGNALIRAGSLDEGFSLLSKAARSNVDYAGSAVATALQVYDGDVVAVRRVLGDVAGTNAALAATMASQNRFDEAVETWMSIPASVRVEKFKPLALSLIDRMIIAKVFRPAALIAADLQPHEGEKPVIGQVGNGSFESGIKLRNAGLFEWRIAEGGQPQIGLVEGQAHGGRYSLFVLFNTFATADFRDISQTVAVEPAAEYELEMFFKSDLKTPAALKWQIVDATTMQPITSTPYLVPAPDWTALSARFTIPAGSDGVVIRLIRDGCTGPACQMNGKLSFDDISLKRL
jgi:hypothetical protein